jgi:hypothetical protein
VKGGGRGGQGGGQLPSHFFAEKKAPPAAAPRRITTFITICPPTPMKPLTPLGGVKSENLSPSFLTFSVSCYLSLPKSLDISPAVRCLFQLLSFELKFTTNTFYSTPGPRIIRFLGLGKSRIK